MATTAELDNLFLPDFCGIRMVFSIVVVGELLAFLLVLTPAWGGGSAWNDLALISLFVQWVALSSAAVLCLSRRWLKLMSNVSAGIISYGLVLLVTVALSEAGYWLVPGSMGIQFSDPWHADFLLRNLAISAIVSALALRYFYVQFQWKTNLESEMRARIQALQSRIRPHFLFNSMNTIASLTRSNPELAEQVVEDLADLFRVSLGDARVPVTLDRELEVCREYLRIEALRLGERLRTEWALDGLPDDALLPALILHPLLENAVYHGVEPAPEGGEVRVLGRREGDQLHIEVGNTVSANAEAKQREGNRIAQDNVAQRLRAFFGPKAALAVESGEGAYHVRMTFPYVTEAPS